MANVVEMNTNDRVMPVRLTDEKSGKVYELDFMLLAAQVKIIVHTLNCVCILTAAHIECRLSQKIAVLERNDFVCVIFSYFVIDFWANILSSA